MIYLPLNVDPNYYAGDDGYIYHIKLMEGGPKVLRLQNDVSTGYARVKIHGKRYQVHNLVASVYCKRYFPSLNMVGHKNGDPFDNRPSNLYWRDWSDINKGRFKGENDV